MNDGREPCEIVITLRTKSSATIKRQMAIDIPEKMSPLAESVFDAAKMGALEHIRKLAEHL